MVFHGFLGYHNVVDVIAVTILPSRFTLLRSARAIALWKVAEALHLPKSMWLHSKSPSSQANAVFWQTAFRTGICQKSQARSILVWILALHSLTRLSSIRGNGYESLTVTSLSVWKSQQNRNSPFFFLTITIEGQ